MRHTRVSAPLAAGALIIALAPAAHAGPLSIVNVNAQAYQSVFSPADFVIVRETVDTFVVSGAAGFARLHSRTTRGQAGAPAAGLYRYSYRLNLVDTWQSSQPPCITSMTIKFGSIVSTLDYNGDGDSGDQVFVVTSGGLGLGSVGLASAVQTGSYVRFTFEGDGVCAGAPDGPGLIFGESSFSFGLVSSRSPRFVRAYLPDQATGPAGCFSPSSFRCRVHAAGAGAKVPPFYCERSVERSFADHRGTLRCLDPRAVLRHGARA